MTVNPLRRFRAWLNRPVNVRDFGADPTGETDSTDAIQAAVNKAASRMGWLPGWLWLPRLARRIAAARRTAYFPAGSYRVGQPPFLDGVTLRGETEGDDSHDR